MISVKQARELVLQHCTRTNFATIKLEESVGLVLAEDIFSNLDIPPFDQSAMDGYAFRFEDLTNDNLLDIDDEIPAGTPIKNLQGVNKSMRIFTGAPVPINADVVVMQEKVDIIDHKIFIKDDQLNKGSNIRSKGSQIKKGEIALKTGTKLNAASIGFLAGLGIATVKVYKAPEIFLIVTGNELQTPGNTLHPGQIYESNSFSLTAALNQMHVNTIKKNIAADDVSQITELIKQGIRSAGMILLTGGVSVGDYDFVTKAAENAGVKMIFHKVKQKPGKPLYFGMANNIPVFGLPGNPASVLTCFYEYVVPAIQQMMGINTDDNSKQLKLASDYQKKQGLTYFLKGKISGKEVELLKAQESFQMGSFAVADCLICLDEEKTDYQKGEFVEVHLI